MMPWPRHRESVLSPSLRWQDQASQFLLPSCAVQDLRCMGVAVGAFRTKHSLTHFLSCGRSPQVANCASIPSQSPSPTWRTSGNVKTDMGADWFSSHKTCMNEEEKKMHQEHEHESPFVILTHLHRDMSRVFSQHVGMSFSRILVLHELMHAGEISQTELQQRLGMEGALLTRFAKQMEAAGLITRR